MTREEKLREMHPGLEDLWKQYQTMLKLVDSSLPPDEPAIGRRTIDEMIALLAGD